VFNIGHASSWPDTVWKISGCDHIHPSTEEKYGHGKNIKDKISKDLMGHVHHDAVAVPPDKAPFESPQSVNIFQEALTGVLDSEVVPAG
jgi:hypothetical protein